MALNIPTIATIYKQEFVAAFEQRQSYLRDSVSSEALVNGESATFLLVGKADTMRQRGVDGRIPNANEIDTQVKIALKEMHHKAQVTSWDIFTAHGDRRRLLQERGMVAANKEMDSTIITALSAATAVYPTVLNAASTSIGKLVDIVSELYEQEVENDGMITFLWTPKAFARLQTLPQLTSVDYVDEKPLVSGQRPFRYLGARHMIHNMLPGMGTATATCFAFHKNAIGHCVDSAGIKTEIGYNGEEDYSYARHSLFHGAGILRQEGIIKFTHDDTSPF